MAALLLGSASTEFLYIINGAPNPAQPRGPVILFIVMWYFVLTIMNWLLRKTR